MTLLKKFIALFISILIIAYSGGISIAQHYCADNLKSTHLNTPITSCLGEEETPCKPGINKAPCCQDEYSFFETHAFDKNGKTTITFAEISNVRDFKLPSIIETIEETLHNYSLPPPDVKSYIRHEQFLI